VFASAFDAGSSDPLVAEFVHRYEAAFGSRPDLWAATAYDAARLVREAVARSGYPSAHDFQRGLQQTSGFQGVSGLTGFSDDGAPRRNLLLLKVQNGAIVPVQGAP
jgi:branched-chain amino acid transport system substrate-binding protein